MPKATLNQSLIEKLTCITGNSKTDYFDTKTTGLLLKVLPTGRKTYYLRYKNLRGKQVECKLASADILKLSQVRELALQHLAQIAMGVDPFEEKKGLKDIPTFADFVAQSYVPHIKGYKKSWTTDISLLKNHLLPALGKLHLDEITRRHIVNLFSAHRAAHMPGSTNRIIILCRYIFNCAIKWETAGITRNPTAGIELYPENNKRERYLSADEAKRLFEILNDSQAKTLKYIVSMLLLTGARRNEVLNSKWEDFDIEHRLWKIEFNKTGRTRYVPLSDGAIQVLQALPVIKGCEYPFANPDTKKPFVGIFYAWDTARKKAGMPDLRIHDLRHSFASFLINGGRSLYEVQKILGHTQVKTTQRYAHLSQDSLISAANTAMKSVPLMQIMPKQVGDVMLLAAKAG